jgi:hypothetical protein
MNTLRSVIDNFIAQLLTVPLDQLLAFRADAPQPPAQAATPRAPRAKKVPGRLARRSPEEIATALNSVAELLKANPDGLRSEAIRTQLDLQAKEMPRIMGEGLRSKVLVKKGEKRATVYYLKAAKKVPVKKTAKSAKKTPAKKTPAKKVPKKAPAKKVVEVIDG